MNQTLTMALVKNANLPTKGDYIIRDTRTPGLGLRVYASGKKSWIFQKKLGNKSVKLVLGPAPSLPLESKSRSGEITKGARQLAEEAAALIRRSLDPRLEKKKQLKQTQESISKNGLTVQIAWEAYVNYKKLLPGKNKPKERTIKDWNNVGAKFSFSAFWKRSILDLTSNDLIQEINRQTSSSNANNASNGGMTQASGAMRCLRAAYNYTLTANKLQTDNPFKELNKLLPKWQTTNARERRIGDTEGSLQIWWSAVDNLRSQGNRDSITIADWLQLSVFFGTRKNELLSLEWVNVDLVNNIIILPATSTKGGRSHVIPLTVHVQSILNRRHQENITRDYIKRDGTHVGKSKWVFQASRKGTITGKIGHIVSPNKTIKKIIETTGIPFSSHDLRRTFATLLNEGGASALTIENALNHSPASVAAKSYVNNPRIISLRKIFQSLEDTILTEAGLKQKQEYVKISVDEYELLIKLKNRTR